MTWRRGAWWLLLFALTFGATGLARAHETRPGYLELREAPDGAYALLWKRPTGGEVEIHFVAFDTSAAQFAFLKSANGAVVEAADGAQLQARLAEIYEKRILAEAAAEQQ